MPYFHLFEGAYSGNVETADGLSRLHADLNIQQKKGNTAIMWAARYKYLDLVQMLVVAKSNLDVANDKGMSALSCRRRSLPQYLEILH